LGTLSIFEVEGDSADPRSYRNDIQHGVVSEVEYWSDLMGARLRAQVYTPPGYMTGLQEYPVLYLLHGAGMSEESWVKVARANYILDNMIAAGDAEPMIVVMPFGNAFPNPGPNVPPGMNFGNSLASELVPFIDESFRTFATADNRAIAGASMGGGMTIQFGLPRPDLFHSFGIWMAGLGMSPFMPSREQYEDANDDALRESAGEAHLVHYAMGTADNYYPTVAPTRALLDDYGFEAVYLESGGGHTGENATRYFIDFVSRLFKD